MATIQKEIEIERSKDFVWDAIGDVGAIHKRLVPGFVIDCKLEANWRTVTFVNGMLVRELIVSVDDNTCRHSWAAVHESLSHYNASVQVFSEGDQKCRVVWIADLMPNEVAGSIDQMIEQARVVANSHARLSVPDQLLAEIESLDESSAFGVEPPERIVT